MCFGKIEEKQSDHGMKPHSFNTVLIDENNQTVFQISYSPPPERYFVIVIQVFYACGYVLCIFYVMVCFFF